MTSDELKKIMLDNAAEITRLHSRIHATYALRKESSEKWQDWEKACDDFHSRYTKLAWPVTSGAEGWLDTISSGDVDAVEAALCFLECRPYFFRSGYMYKDILRKIRRAPMPPEQATRLKVILEKWALYQQLRIRNGR
ncbi:hypothetical protein [Acidicapsa acidisoli]|uniref:hypothetical protein n=1 Tax=Acidicapsa acidisoli TaxID=1615681 RepID=UPI0021DFAC91|nr:hypothetical protein [Acidicapsa acidisoli]